MEKGLIRGKRSLKPHGKDTKFIRNQQEIAFTEFDFYQRYAETFKTSELGRTKSLLPLRQMAISFNLMEERPMHKRVKRGRKSFFTPEGKVALAFLKMYTGLSAPKLMEALNGNIHYQIFCSIRISPENQLTNYKLIDGILLELSVFYSLALI